MRLELGKYYKTRDGQKVEVVGINELDDIVRLSNGHHVFAETGLANRGERPTHTDVVSEWSDSPAQNPKQAFGDKKPSLGLVPLAAEIEETLALMDGEYKYGGFNWRENPVEAMTYVHAAIRHLKLWASGDERTRDTDIHNLGAVKACCSILMDAQTNGTMIDNRPKSPETCDKLHDAEKNVSFLKERLTKK